MEDYDLISILDMPTCVWHFYVMKKTLTLRVPETKIYNFANSLDPDEAAHGWMDVLIIYRRSTSIGHIASKRL